MEGLDTLSRRLIGVFGWNERRVMILRGHLSLVGSVDTAFRQLVLADVALSKLVVVSELTLLEVSTLADKIPLLHQRLF